MRATCATANLRKSTRSPYTCVPTRAKNPTAVIYATRHFLCAKDSQGTCAPTPEKGRIPAIGPAAEDDLRTTATSKPTPACTPENARTPAICATKPTWQTQNSRCISKMLMVFYSVDKPASPRRSSCFSIFCDSTISLTKVINSSLPRLHVFEIGS